MKRRRYLSVAGATTAGVVAFGASLGTGSVPDTTYDLFLIGGQSNAQGYGWYVDKVPTIPAGQAYEFFRADDPKLSHLENPVGGANRGSAWPAFHQEYYAQTGRKAVYVPHGAPAAGLHEKSAPQHNYWNGGGIRDLAEEMLTDCLATLDAKGMTWRYRGLLWSQGLRDAHAIQDGDMTVAEYETALSEFRNWVANHPTMGQGDFYIFETGHDNHRDGPVFKAVREAQQRLATDRADTHMVSQLQKDFPERGLMRDKHHYSQEGLNLMGQTGAENVANILNGDGATTTTAGSCST